MLREQEVARPRPDLVIIPDQLPPPLNPQIKLLALLESWAKLGFDKTYSKEGWVGKGVYPFSRRGDRYLFARFNYTSQQLTLSDDRRVGKIDITAPFSIGHIVVPEPFDSQTLHEVIVFINDETTILLHPDGKTERVINNYSQIPYHFLFHPASRGKIQKKAWISVEALA